MPHAVLAHPRLAIHSDLAHSDATPRPLVPDLRLVRFRPRDLHKFPETVIPLARLLRWCRCKGGVPSFIGFIHLVLYAAC